MAYDEKLAERVRDLLAHDAEVTERRMFGGLAFLVRGHMGVVVSRQGGLMVRAEADHADRLIATTSARPMEMRGRPMRGWVRVDAGAVARRPQLEKWVTIGVGCARARPPRA